MGWTQTATLPISARIPRIAPGFMTATVLPKDYGRLSPLMFSSADWERLGSTVDLRGHKVFVIDLRPIQELAEPLLVLHGFPSCSFDYRHVLPALSEGRRVILLDMLGYGLSDKPLDHRYSLFEQADIVQELITELGIDELALITHDMGDSVGGELLARSLDGGLGFEFTRRVITNGSIYMDLVQLSAGQQVLLSLPDEPLPADSSPSGPNGPDGTALKNGLAATFGPDTQPSEEELESQWKLLSRNEGQRILPRLIRYVEERRVHESRWTGAIEAHRSPLTVIWGELDPIAVYAMAERLYAKVAHSNLVRLDGVGHYPMIEAPSRFADAATAALD